MIQMEKWFEREFDLSIPVGRFPAVVERLRGTPVRLAERLAGWDRQRLIRREGDGWSVQENAGHLLDLEPLWLQRVQDLIAGRPELTAADLSNRATRNAGHDQRPLPEILANFRQARGQMVRLLDDAGEELAVRCAIHPRLRKPLRLLDLAYFVAEHDDHHLARITWLLQFPPD